MATKAMEIEVTVCDSCGEERPLRVCSYCGAKICEFCSARVHYTQLGNVRWMKMGFTYGKIMCQKHLPEVTNGNDS